jgi:hypothetical protein
MALALLDLVALEGSSVRFRIDTGTNRWYQLKLGRGVRDRSGVEWIDEVVFQTPVAENPAGGGMLHTSTEVEVPADGLERDRAYAQLFSFKTAKGGGPAFSSVVRVDRAATIAGPEYVEPEWTEVQEHMNSTLQTFNRPRQVPTRTFAEQFSAPAFGDLLAQIARVAGPVVLRMLAGEKPAAGAPPAAGVGQGAGGAGADPFAGLIEGILKLIPGLAPAPAPAPPAQQVAAPASLDVENRFGNGRSRLARPFVFGIDDALLATLIGPVIGQVVGILPQLQNAANQRRIQLQAGHNKLVSDAISAINQRLLMDKVLEAQRQSSGQQAADLAKLADLLQQAGVSTQPAAAETAPATTQSVAEYSGGTISNRALAAFVTAPPVPWNGTAHVLFPKGQPLQLKVQLVVAEPVPKAPLPKAIVRVCVKDPSSQDVLAEKVVKQRDLAANATVVVPFTAEELAKVPTGKPVSLLAEIRWLTAGGAERKALGSTEAVVIDRYFVKERTATGGEERELTDMDRFRAFWNKVWESPALDAATSGARKLLWELDATMKYALLLAPAHDSNGVMETKFLVAAKDAEAVSDRTEGRLKAGMELSLDELCKLAPLWPEQQPLDPQRLAAFKTEDFAKSAGGEIVHRLQLKGRAAERGLVWVVPVLGLVEYALGAVQATDESGQVTQIAEEKVRLPLPVALRVLALKSSDEESSEEAEGEKPAYVFDGFKIELSEKVALMPGGAAAPKAEGQWLRG